MKTLFPIYVLLFLSLHAHSQGLWTQKNSTYFSSSRASASFVLAGKGYVYTGDSLNNFFAYDPLADSWTPRSNFPGGARAMATGFGTDSFGYIGNGKGARILNTFYKYDPISDSWSSIASYPDSVYGAMSLSIGTSGFVAGGSTDTGIIRRVYQYDQTANTWIQKASLPLVLMEGFAATVNSKGYVGLGITKGLLGVTGRIDSVFQYDPVANSWSLKASLRLNASTSTYPLYSFSINNKIYLSDAYALSGPQHAGMQVLDVLANSWSVINSYPYPAVLCTMFTPEVAFSINNKGYLRGFQSCLISTLTNFWEYDTANYFHLNSFIPSDTVCEGDLITVNISSNLTFNNGNYFKLRLDADYNAVSDSVAGTTGGSYTFHVPHNAASPARARVSLGVYATNPAHQTDYLPLTLVVKKAPSNLDLAPSYYACAGSTLLLYRENKTGESHMWSSNPTGISGTGYTLSLSPATTTTIYAYDVYTATGCSVRDTTTVIPIANPTLSITDSALYICPGGSTMLGGTAVTNAGYQWKVGTTVISTTVNPVVSPTANTTYHLVLKDTVTSCTSAGNTTVTINNPPAQKICFVTVDSASTHNIVVWEKLDKNATDSFYISRETSTSVYTQIGAVQRDSLSEYHDYGANPNITAYRYKISTKDTCGNTGTLSNYHNSIHLQYLGAGNLIWNVYGIENEITPVNSFDVYRDSLANGNWDIMLNVPGNQYTATDINFLRHPNALYRIAANWAYSCTPSRSANNTVLSNVIAISPTGVTDMLSVYSIRLYPNPADDELIIDMGGIQAEEVSILGTEGKMVTQFHQPAHNKLDISALANGIYIAEIKTQHMTQRIKWVKM